jgi:hypothetical protein
VRVAQVGIAVFLLFLAVLGLAGAAYGFWGDPGDLGRKAGIAIGFVWLASALVFGLTAVLLFRAPGITGRTVGMLIAVLVIGALLLTITPIVGAPVTALAALVAVLGFRSSGP